MKRTDGPHVRVYQGSSLTLLPATAYEPLTHGLQCGSAWWEGTDLYGSPILIRLESITDVTLCTVEALAAAAEDNDTPWENAHA